MQIVSKEGENLYEMSLADNTCFFLISTLDSGN